MSKNNKYHLDPKVIGSGGGGVVALFIWWLLGVTVWGVDFTSASAGDALAAVPFPVIFAIQAACIVAGGYLPRNLSSVLFEAENAPEQPSDGVMGGGSDQPEYYAEAAVEDLDDDADDGTTNEPSEDEVPVSRFH